MGFLLLLFCFRSLLVFGVLLVVTVDLVVLVYFVYLDGLFWFAMFCCYYLVWVELCLLLLGWV